MAKLAIVPTPIGNLQDITLRGLEYLQQADFILAEDTRTSGFLLAHFSIKKPLVSYHKFNEKMRVSQLLERISQANLCVLISDAGTPGISDPGHILVQACIEAGIEVECLPGATALIPALVVSGFSSEAFCFEGFLPHKKGRQTRLLALKDEKRTIIFYESPHRITKTLAQIIEFMGDREVSISRELSKKFEEHIRGLASEVLLLCEEKPCKGEIVLVVKGADI